MKSEFLFSLVLIFHNYLAEGRNSTSNLTSEQILTKKFFEKLPDPRVRPMRENGSSILVKLEYVVLSLININQREQHMVLFGWINMRWNNTKVTWNLTEYDVKFLIIESVKIWFPNFAIRNSADKVFGDMFDHEKYRAQVFWTGQIAYSTAGKTTTFCTLDLTYFPFDSQSCYLEIFSWTYSEEQLSLSTFGKEIDTSHFNVNGQWTLEKSKVRILSLNISSDTYSVARFIFLFKRKPRYFIIILVIPCTVMSFLVVFVYLLPADSSEKISLSITTLLAYSVFQLTVSDNMPKTSSYIPLIMAVQHLLHHSSIPGDMTITFTFFSINQMITSVYISFVLFFSTLSLLTTILVLMIHHHVLMEKPPRWLFKLVSTGLSKFLGTQVIVDHGARLRKSVLKRRANSPSKPRLNFISSGKLDLENRESFDLRARPSGGSIASSRWKNSFSVLTRKIARIKEEEGIENLFSSEFASSKEEKIKQQWTEIVETLDRLFLIVFTTLNLIACLLTFVILPYTAPSVGKEW